MPRLLHELTAKTRIFVYLQISQAFYFSFFLADQRRLADVVQHGAFITLLSLSIALFRQTVGRQTNSLSSTVVISLTAILLPIPVVTETLYWRKICRTKPLRIHLNQPTLVGPAFNFVGLFSVAICLPLIFGSHIWNFGVGLYAGSFRSTFQCMPTKQMFLLSLIALFGGLATTILSSLYLVYIDILEKIFRKDS